MGLRRYRELLAIPGVRRLMLATFVGRLPYGMSVVALILLLRAHGFDYAVVGIVTAASALSVGVAAPILGRVIDRAGQTRPLVVTAALAVLTGVALVLAAAAGAGAAPLTVLAALNGLSAPPVSPAMRTLFPEVVGPERVDTAFAFDALQLELVFIFGPLFAAAVAATISPEASYLTGIAFEGGGALMLAASPASRRWRPPPREPGERHAGALALPGLRILVLSLAITAVSLGVLEIGIAAFAERHATRADSGWLFALWGLGSLTGGLWYGARHWRMAAHLRFLLVTGVLVAGLAPLPLADSMLAFALLLVVAGLGLAPSTVAGYSLISELAPAGAMTEAYSWQIVGYVAGSAAGAWLAGVVVERHGVTAALVCAPFAAALGLLVAVAGRRAITV